MLVLILGGGYTGQRLAQFLDDRAVPVRITTRQGHPIPGLSAPCFPFCQTTGGVQTPLAPAALDQITHVVSTIPPDDRGQDPVLSSLLPQLLSLNPVWVGYLSTTGVYGDTQGAWVDETTPVKPQNLRSQHRVAIETAFLQSGLPAHIFRLPGIYGPGRSALDRLRRGQAHRIDKPGHVFCRIHVDDIVQTLWASMEQPQPLSIYNVCDDEPSEPGDLLVEAAHLLGLQPPAAIPFAQAQLSPMGASFWEECRRVSNQKIKQELGVQLRYPTYREGLRGILLEEQS